MHVTLVKISFEYYGYGHFYNVKRILRYVRVEKNIRKNFKGIKTRPNKERLKELELFKLGLNKKKS